MRRILGLSTMSDDAQVFSKIYEEGLNTIQLYDVPMQRPRNRRRNGYLDDFVVPSQAGVPMNQVHPDSTYSIDFMRSNLWDPFLAKIKESLDERFSPETMELADVTFIVESDAEIKSRIENTMNQFIAKYPGVLLKNDQVLDAATLEYEYRMVRGVVLQADAAKSDIVGYKCISGKAHSLLHFMVNDPTRLNVTCKLYFEYLCLACTIPFTSASCERAFSKLKIIKNRLRSKMKDGRLGALMLMSSNKDILKKFDTKGDIVPAWHRKSHDDGKLRRIKIDIM